MFEEHLDIRWGRRLITTPLWFVIAVVLWVVPPVAIPALLVWDFFSGRRWSAVRTWLFFTVFFTIESCALVLALAIWLRALATRSDRQEYYLLNRRLQRWWARNLFWSCVRIFDVDVVVHGREILEDHRNALVLSRHASTLDTMIPLAIIRELREYRYVIKAELLADPAMDFVAQRFPNCFVRRGGQFSETEVRRVVALGETLEEGGAVVIYPEGTRYTHSKRQRLLDKFTESDPDDLLPVVQRLKHTLPPLREGAVKLVETMRDADAIFLAHRGLEQAGAMSDLIHGRLTGAQLEIEIWRVDAADVPREPEQIRAFLIEHWAKIDDFVGAQNERREPPERSPASHGRRSPPASARHGERAIEARS